MREFGALDVLVNNAGIYNRALAEETTLEEWEWVMERQCHAACSWVPGPPSRPCGRSGGGSIVNMSSVAGLVGSRTQTVYNASKGAVRLLTKSTAVQYALEGIRANSVHPGVIETDMLSEVLRNEDERATRIASDAHPQVRHARGRGHTASCSSPPTSPATSRAPSW